MTRHHLINGIKVDYTAEEEVARDAEEAKVLADKQANKYQRDRANEYPSIVDQLDYIYHNGVTKWKTDMITPVKEKYPKPRLKKL